MLVTKGKRLTEFIELVRSIERGSKLLSFYILSMLPLLPLPDLTTAVMDFTTIDNEPYITRSVSTDTILCRYGQKR